LKGGAELFGLEKKKKKKGRAGSRFTKKKGKKAIVSCVGREQREIPALRITERGKKGPLHHVGQEKKE